MPTFPQPPDVPAYVPREVTYGTEQIRGDGSNSYGGTPPAFEIEPPDHNETDDMTGWVIPGSYNKQTAAEGAGEGKFRTHANFSHFGRDDPIRNYGQPDSAHWHMFFGNRSVNAFSTYKTLRMNPDSTAAGGRANGTGYWTPALLKVVDGKTYALPMNVALIYYTQEMSKALLNELVRLPRGLRYIAGVHMDDPQLTARKAEVAAANAANPSLGLRDPWDGWGGWMINPVGGGTLPIVNPGPGATATHSRYLVNPDGSDPWGGQVPANSEMYAVLNAPEWWDGYNLHADGGYDHFRFAVHSDGLGKRIGPQGWWEVPQLQLSLQWYLAEANEHLTLSLSSDPMLEAKLGVPNGKGGSMHFDWFGAWKYTVMLEFMRNSTGVEGFEPGLLQDSTLSEANRLISAGEAAPNGRFPQVNMANNQFPAIPSRMMLLPTGAGKGPATILQKGS